MTRMAKQMRNRFFVSLVFTLAILAWSALGNTIVGHALAVPLGLDRNVWELVLSLPVLYAARMFFTGAVWALRQPTLDMNVLVATAIGISWIYSLAVTLGLAGDVFSDAGAMLATFVLLEHWFEMRDDRGVRLPAGPRRYGGSGVERAHPCPVSVRHRPARPVGRAVNRWARPAAVLVRAEHPKQPKLEDGERQHCDDDECYQHGCPPSVFPSWKGLKWTPSMPG